MNEKFIEETFSKLENYCRRESYKGYDPFDGLNSNLFKYFPVLRKSSIFKLVWIQLFKRNPINFRKIAGITLILKSKLFLLKYLWRSNN